MKYDPTELQEAVERGERKLAERRQRARRQKTRATWALVALVALGVAGVGLWAGTRHRAVPSVPRLVVTWPESKTPQQVRSGDTVLARDGEPINVSLSNSSEWNVSWGSGAVGNTGDAFSWAPQKEGETLQVHARAKGTGWSKNVSPETLSPQLSLRAALATREPAPTQATPAPTGTPAPTSGAVSPVLEAQNYRRSIAASKGEVWLLPSVQSGANIAWDERAISALSQSAPIAPRSKTQTASALWQLASDFEGNLSPSSSEALAPDGATYATLHADDLTDLMPQIGAQLVRLTPDASIKWIARLDQTPPEGIVRLSFDGKKTRQAWIKQKGAKTGALITGWEQGAWKGTPAPIAPTPSPTSHQ